LQVSPLVNFWKQIVEAQYEEDPMAILYGLTDPEVVIKNTEESLKPYLEQTDMQFIAKVEEMRLKDKEGSDYSHSIHIDSDISYNTDQIKNFISGNPVLIMISDLWNRSYRWLSE